MKVALAFGICVLLFGMFGDDHGLPAVLQVRRDARRLSAEIAALRDANAALRRRVEALRGDPAAIEIEARSTLGLMRPGEVVVTRRR